MKFFIVFSLYFIFCQKIGKAESGSSSQQETQGSNQIYKPFWANRGRRSDRLRENENYVLATNSFEDLSAFDLVKESRLKTPWINRVESDLLLPNTKKGTTFVSGNKVRKLSPTETLEIVAADEPMTPVIYYIWYNLQKKSENPANTPGLPFWATRG